MARIRRLTLISSIATMLCIAVVLTVIGYRVFRTEGRPGPIEPIEVVAQLPKGARLLSASIAGDRIAVTIDVGGSLEVRTFDARTLSPQGRLRFVAEP